MRDDLALADRHGVAASELVTNALGRGLLGVRLRPNEDTERESEYEAPPESSASAHFGTSWNGLFLEQPRHAVEDAMGDLDLGHERQVLAAATGVEEGDAIVINRESSVRRGHIVRNDEGSALRSELLQRVLDEILRLGGKDHLHE